jgi:PAS domain S-box-containing protein
MSNPAKVSISFRSASVLAALVVLAHLAIITLVQSPDLRIALDDMLFPLANGLSAGGLLYAWRSETSDRQVRAAWGLLALAQLFYALGDVIWAVIEAGLRQNPFPSLADGPYLLFYPVFLIGILLLPPAYISRSDRLKMLLDTGVVMIAGIMLFWNLLIAPTIASATEEDLLVQTISVAYPVMDLVLLFALIQLLFRRLSSPGQGPLLLLTLSTAAMIVTDVLFMLQSLNGTYQAARLLDTGWLLNYIFAGLAGVLYANTRLQEPASPERGYVKYAWPLYIPYLCAGGAYLLLIWSHDNPQPMGFYAMGLGVGGIIALVIVRQIAAMDENMRLYQATLKEIEERKRAEEKIRRLNDELERRVVERTGQLEALNKDLQREIDVRRLAEEELRESEDRLKTILNSIQMGVIIIDPESHQIIDANPVAIKMIGAERKNILGSVCHRFICPAEQGKCPITDLSQTIDSSERILIDFRGLAIPIIKTVIPVTLKGREYLLESFSDITGLKLAEEALRKAHDELELRVKERTEELERRTAEMERFIYTVSHDLRSPLITVGGFVGFLKRDLEKGDRERTNADLRMIEDAIERMDHLLGDTLELSRIGRIANPPENVPFDEIVKEALDQTAEKLRSRGIEVSVAHDLPAVNVDRMRIVEVLVNLIENSVRYMGDQPQPKIDVGYRLDGAETVFFIRDNGIGIDPSQHEKVFGLFYKVDPKSEGNGAGLAIVKRIIEVHGGRIWIESELGKGCTVCFTLPLA